MKKTAVALFPYFCNYKLSVLLEILALNEKPVTFFSSELIPFRCEEGMQAIADTTFESCVIEEYDSLVITGSYAEGLAYNFADRKLIEFIRLFHEQKKLIAAISSGPMVLCKAGITGGRKFLAGVEKEWFLSEPSMLLTARQMEGLIDVNDMKHRIDQGEAEPEFLLDGNILTAVGWKFREWAVAVANAMGLEGYPSSFGIISEK